MDESTDQGNVETVHVGFSAPVEIWRRIKFLATVRRCSSQSIWLDAVSEYLDRADETTDAA